MAYTILPSEDANATPMRPSVVVGRPLLRSPEMRVQRLPPSVVRHSAEPGPPLLSEYAVRTRSHDVAIRMSGLVGCIVRSTKPARSLTKLTLRQVWPPSVVLKRPRSRLAPHGRPSAATYTALGSRGSMRIRPMAWVSRSPMYVQVRPASVDLKTPAPGEMGLRLSSSPVPAQMIAVSDGAMASSLTACAPAASKMGGQVRPAVTDLHTPPPARPPP